MIRCIAWALVTLHLTNTSHAAAELGLRWNAPPSHESNVTYRVYVSPEPDARIHASKCFNVGTNRWVVVGPLDPGVPKWFTVTANRDGKESAPAQEIGFVVPWVISKTDKTGARFEFLKPIAQGNVNYVLEFSKNLTDWGDPFPFEAKSQVFPNGVETLYVDVPFTLQYPYVFARVRLEFL